MKIFYCISLLLLFGTTVKALYEDQVGQADWIKRYVGIPSLAAISVVDDSESVFVFSELKETISKLNGKNGNIIWRKKLDFTGERVEKGIKLIVIDAKDQVRRQQHHVGLVSVHSTSKNIVISAFDEKDGILIYSEEYPLSARISQLTEVQVEAVPEKRVVLISVPTSDGTGQKLVSFNLGTGKFIKDTKLIGNVFGFCDNQIVVGSPGKIIKYNIPDFVVSKETSLSTAEEGGYIPVGSIGNKYAFMKDSKLALFDEKGEFISGLSSNSTHGKFHVQGDYLTSDNKLIAKVQENKFEAISVADSRQFVGEIIVLGRSLFGISTSLKVMNINEDGKTVEYLFPESFSTNARGTPKLMAMSKNTKSTIVIASFTDGSISMFAISKSGVMKEIFTREEGLSSVASKSLFFEKPRFMEEKSSTGIEGAVSASVEADEHLLKLFAELNQHSNGQLVTFTWPLFIARLNSQYQAFINIFKGIGETIKAFLVDLFQSNGQFILDLYNGEIKAKSYTLDEKHNFGFVKLIILASTTGKIFALDSEGNQIYSIFISDLGNDLVSYQVERQHQKGDAPPTFSIASSKAAFIIDALTGRILHEFKAKSVIEDIITIDEDIALIIETHPSDTLSGHFFPKPTSTDESFPAVTYTRFSASKNSVEGCRFDVTTGHFVKEYSFALPEGEIGILLTKHSKDVYQSVGRPIGGGSLMIKHINPNIIAAFSTLADSANGVSLHIIDGGTGALLGRYSQDFCVPNSISALMFENNLIYSCFAASSDSGALTTSLMSFSFYWDMVIDKFDLNPIKLPKTVGMLSSHSEHPRSRESEVLIEQNAFEVDRLVKSLSFTSTLHGISEKSVIITFENGQIALLDKRLIDPRRPIPVGVKDKMALTEAEKEEGVLPYMPKIPIRSDTILSYYLRMEDIKFVSTAATKLESTCLIFATGLDHYFSRIQPSAGFDLLPEEFNHPLLMIMVLGMTVGVAILVYALSKKKLAEQWK